MSNTEPVSQDPVNLDNQTLPMQQGSRFDDANFINNESEFKSFDQFKKKYKEQFQPRMKYGVLNGKNIKKQTIASSLDFVYNYSMSYMFDVHDVFSKSLSIRAQMIANDNMDYKTLYLELMNSLKQGYWECMLELSHESEKNQLSSLLKMSINGRDDSALEEPDGVEPFHVRGMTHVPVDQPGTDQTDPSHYRSFGFASKINSDKTIQLFQSRKDDIKSWLFQLDLAFRRYNVPYQERGMVAVSFIKKSALDEVYSWMKNDNGSYDWDQLERWLITNFMPQNFQSELRHKLKYIRHQINNKETIIEYNERFLKLINKAENLSLQDKLNFYIDGLRPKTQIEVSPKNFVTLTDLMQTATNYEQILERQQTLEKRTDIDFQNKEIKHVNNYNIICRNCNKYYILYFLS
jgi:hypothetical protein